MNYQWYPGHMTKARRMMEENIKLIDLVIELVDARIPLSSRNPDIDGLAKNNARIILLNKSDLSDERKNVMWIDYFTKKGFYVLKLNTLLITIIECFRKETFMFVNFSEEVRHILKNAEKERDDLKWRKDTIQK